MIQFDSVGWERWWHSTPAGGLARRNRKLGPATPRVRLPRGARRRAAGFFLGAFPILLVEPKGFPFPACLIQEQAGGLMVVAAQLADCDFALTSDHRFTQNSSTYGRHHGTNRVIPPKPLWTLWTLLKYFFGFPVQGSRVPGFRVRKGAGNYRSGIADLRFEQPPRSRSTRIHPGRCSGAAR